MEQPPSPLHGRPVTDEGMPNAEAVEELMEKRNISYDDADRIINGPPERSPGKAVRSRTKRPNTRGGRSYPEPSGRDMTRAIEEAATDYAPMTVEDRESAARGIAAIRRALHDKKQT